MRRRLNVQGLSDVNDEVLAATAPWHRMAFATCALLAAIGTALALPVILWMLTPVAALATLFPVLPFDLVYNHGIRYLLNMDQHIKELLLIGVVLVLTLIAYFFNRRSGDNASQKAERQLTGIPGAFMVSGRTAKFFEPFATMFTRQPGKFNPRRRP